MSDAPDPEPAGTEASDLDALVQRADPDRWLSSRFVGDAQARADVIALYAFDHELARAPKVASNPLLGEIRLTWWAEALGEIFEGGTVRRHPTAQALAQAVRCRSLPRAPLEAMIEARYRELDAAPMAEGEILDWAAGSAGSAASLAAAILDPGASPEAASAAGQAWAVALRQAARAPDAPDLRPALRALAPAARRAGRSLSVAAFPAIAHAALARPYGRGRSPSELEKRLRLTWAVATGRL